LLGLDVDSSLDGRPATQRLTHTDHDGDWTGAEAVEGICEKPHLYNAIRGTFPH
jgi:hypothetical protein